MPSFILHWFQPPQFPEDEDKTRSALLLNVVLNTFLAALPVIFVGNILNGLAPRAEYNLLIIACAWLTIFGTKQIMFRGHVAAAGFVTITIIFIATTLAVYNIGSIRAPAASFYIVAIVMSGMVINRRAILWTTCICGAAFTALLYAEMHGWLSVPTLTVTITQGITFLVIFAVVSTLLHLAVKSIDEALLRARQELKERRLAEEREQSRRKIMEKVIRLGKHVTEVTDLRTTLLRIWHGVHDDLDFDRVGIFLYNPFDKTMEGSFGTDRSGQFAEEWHIKFKAVDTHSSFYRLITRPDGYFYTEDYEALNNVPVTGHLMSGVKHYAAVAAWSGDEPIGIVCVDQLISGRSISEEQLEALRLFAGSIGPAIQNARFNQRETKRQYMLKKVIELGKIVTEVTDLQTTLIRIWDGVREGLDFDRVGIFLYDPAENIMQGTYGTDRSGKLVEAWHVKFELDSQALFHTVLARPDGLYFTKDYEIEQDVPLGHDMLGVKHYVAVAVWAGDKPMAIISVDQLVSGRAISDEQVEALRLFAGYTGFAIQNARLNSELEGRVEERGRFIKELGERNSELERFTYTVSHDLRSPIVTIKGFLGMLKEDLSKQQIDRADHDMYRISNAADKMESLLSDLLELSRIGRVVNSPEEINLVKLVNETLETVDGRIRAKNITIRVAPDLPTIHGDRLRLREVFENLIDNAAKYMGDQPAPVIEICAKNQSGEEVIFVKDNGLGIESQYLTRVFGLFEKLDPASEGTGIGLALVKRIIEIHGGKIWVESEGSLKGSTFYFTIPTPGKTNDKG